MSDRWLFRSEAAYQIGWLQGSTSHRVSRVTIMVIIATMNCNRLYPFENIVAKANVIAACFSIIELYVHFPSRQKPLVELSSFGFLSPLTSERAFLRPAQIDSLPRLGEMRRPRN